LGFRIPQKNKVPSARERDSFDQEAQKRGGKNFNAKDRRRRTSYEKGRWVISPLPKNIEVTLGARRRTRGIYSEEKWESHNLKNFKAGGGVTKQKTLEIPVKK